MSAFLSSEDGGSPDRRSRLREANLRALDGRIPPLAGLIRSLSPDLPSPLVPLTAQNGQASAKTVAGVWLHSPRAPEEEAQRLVEAALDPVADVAVLLGFGLGYLAEACLDRSLSAILVCEADPAALAAALDLRNMERLLADERVGFMVGGDAGAVLSALELSGGSRASLVGLRAAELSSPEWYTLVREAVQRWNAKGSANENTLRKFGRLWVRNLAKNRRAVSRTPGVRTLEGRFAGQPAVVLAAGPSLDAVLPQLREIAQRAVVVCVDTALRSLALHGVDPDFLVVVDPQYWNWRHIAGLDARRTVMISESAAWPAVLRTACRCRFLGGSLFPLGRRLESFSGEKGRLGAGGSVATSAWDLARLLGCEPIWMAGLDLGYPGGATHARASLFEQLSFARGTRLKPAEVEQVSSIHGLPGSLAPSMSGGTIRTDPRMGLYGWWFEAKLARADAPRTLSLSPGGLAIPGMALASLDELLGTAPCREKLDAILADIDSLAPREGEEGPDSAADSSGGPEGGAASGPEGDPGGDPPGMAALLAELGSIESEALAALDLARELRGSLARGGAGAARGSAFGAALGAASGADLVESALAALDRADSALASCAAKDITGFLLPPLGELLARRARTLEENLEQSEAIYRSVAESARYHVEKLSAG